MPVDLNSSQQQVSLCGISRTVADYIPILRKCQYQVATRNSQKSNVSLTNDDSDHPSKYPAHEVRLRRLPNV